MAIVRDRVGGDPPAGRYRRDQDDQKLSDPPARIHQPGNKDGGRKRRDADNERPADRLIDNTNVRENDVGDLQEQPGDNEMRNPGAHDVSAEPSRRGRLIGSHLLSI